MSREVVWTISIHAPRTGSDIANSRNVLLPFHFNPRSPHGERRGERAETQMDSAISIHAPRTGSDDYQLPLSCLRRYFNPRSPHGERRNLTLSASVRRKFQSTLPARGATLRRLKRLGQVVISIHAPRTGSDGESYETKHEVKHISIHAPRTGSDRYGVSSLMVKIHFNPRSPHGERHITSASGKSPKIFQSTLPARGATVCLAVWLQAGRFQSTLPARGATTRRQSQMARINNFNPRSPHGERRRVFLIFRRVQHFNPRSPHGERRS